ncbi:WD repeat-containing protein 89 [Hypomesus transpacificus]|uniref:WD repeat-containing protein 89 n=1 Tax=Hypomesus transpacificus TaxID=137520 RepID=UPI001F0775C1|nr:WD repeat-containing protein 89 [Hypomesus transpacificus]
MESVEEKFKALSIARRVQPREPTYLLDMSVQRVSGPGPGLLAVCCSNRSIHLHCKDNLSLLGEYQGHGGPLCGVSFAHRSPDLLFSGSADGTVRTWDVRRPGSEAVQVFRSDPYHHFCSFDVSCSDEVLCAGTEQVDGEDSFLVFWDGRMTKEKSCGVLGVYSESHSDDITQVRFHPSNKDRLASGSTDGLVNVFDLSQGSEEEALMATCNSGSSASSVCWSGKDLNQLLCLSHDEGMHLWDLGQIDTNEPLTVFCTPDARSLTPLSDGRPLDYLVSGMWLEEEQCLLVLGGENHGDLHVLECSGKGLRLVKSLRGGHSAMVRCFVWDTEGGALFTGGEDAQLLLWKPGTRELTSGKRDTLKSGSAIKLKSRPHKKHGYQKREEA